MDKAAERKRTVDEIGEVTWMGEWMGRWMGGKGEMDRRGWMKTM
jgi:hypothetical protein